MFLSQEHKSLVMVKEIILYNPSMSFSRKSYHILSMSVFSQITKICQQSIGDPLWAFRLAILASWHDHTTKYEISLASNKRETWKRQHNSGWKHVIRHHGQTFMRIQQLLDGSTGPAVLRSNHLISTDSLSALLLSVCPVGLLSFPIVCFIKTNTKKKRKE